MLGQGAAGNHNMQNMGVHNSGAQEVIGGNYNGMGLMQGGDGNLGLNNLNQNMVVHINPLNNMNGFNPSMNGMNGMGGQTAPNQAQNLGTVNQNMVLLQQSFQPILSNQLNQGLDNNEMMGQTNSQYGRMNMYNHGN